MDEWLSSTRIPPDAGPEPAIEEIVLESEGLRLRPMHPADLPQLAQWWEDPEVQFGFCSPPRPLDSLIEAFAETEAEARDIGHWIDFVIEVDGERIGSIWFSRWDLEDATCELNILIGEPDYRSRKVARKAIGVICAWAFPKMDLRRIYLVPREDHVPAIRCYQGVGAKLGEVREEVVVWQGETVCFREMYLEAHQFATP